MKNILFGEDSSRRVTGAIERAVTPGWWIIRDDSGRRHKVASQDLWRKGERVAVVGGQIVGHAGKGKGERICVV